MNEKQCATCHHWLAREGREWLQMGFARCAHLPRWVVKPAHTTCEKHKLAEGAERRVAWLAQRGLVTA